MALVKCSSCGGGIHTSLFHEGGTVSCPLCQRTLHAFLLPALYKPAVSAPPSLPDDPPAPGEATCFYNPSRRATKCCDHCGVYVSEAWAAHWGTQTVCLKCLEELRSKNSDIRFESKRVLWDNIALSFAIGPWFLMVACWVTLIFYWLSFLILILTVLTAPAAIFIALRYWQAPRSLVPRGRGRLVWAILLGVLQLLGWIAVIVGIFYAAGES